MAPRQGAGPGAIPGNRTNFANDEGRMTDDESLCVERQLAQPGLQNPAGLGQHQGDAPFLKFQISYLKFHIGAVADK